MKLPLIDPERWLNRWRFLADLAFSPAGTAIWLLLVGYAAAQVALNWPALADDVTDRILSLENLFLIAASQTKDKSSLSEGRMQETVRMLIDAERLGREYVYVATIQDAPPISGQFRGNMGVWTKNGVVEISQAVHQAELVGACRRDRGRRPRRGLGRGATGRTAPP